MARSSSRSQHTMPDPKADQLFPEPILPQSTRNLVEKVSHSYRHPGLQLDKLSPVGDGKMEAQKAALEKVIASHSDNQLLKDLLARRAATLHALGAARLPMATRGSLTLHLSRSGALENAGIALHPIYGFVYLPGSGIKGLTRAWAETVWAVAQTDKEAAWRRIEEVFGWSPGSERHKKGWRPDEIEPPANRRSRPTRLSRCLSNSLARPDYRHRQQSSPGLLRRQRRSRRLGRPKPRVFPRRWPGRTVRVRSF